MTDKAVSALTSLTGANTATGDLLYIVDISEAAAADRSKKITVGDIHVSIPNGTNSAPSIAFASDPDTGIFRAGANSLAFAVGGTQAVTVDSSGNVGIGIAPGGSYKLQVNGNVYASAIKIGEASAFLSNSPDALIGWASSFSGYTNGTLILQSRSSAGTPIVFATGTTSATERAQITSGGDFLVGTDDASEISETGARLLATGAVRSTRSGSTNASSTLDVYSTGASAFRFYVTMDGTVNATVGTISTISDQRLKENIRDLNVGLSEVMALKPRLFDWKTGKGQDKKDVRGFIAQEFEQVFPDLIDTWKDPAPEGEEPYKSVRQDLIPVLVKAIQELKAEFDAYKASHA